MLHAKLNFMFTIQRCMPSRTFFRLAPSFSFDCNAFTIELTFRFWIPLFHLLLLFLLISFSKWIFVCLPLKHKVRIKKMHSEWTTCRAACTNSIIWWQTEGKKGEEWKKWASYIQGAAKWELYIDFFFIVLFLWYLLGVFFLFYSLSLVIFIHSLCVLFGLALHTLIFPFFIIL